MNRRLSITLVLLLTAVLGGTVARADAFRANARGSYFRYAPKAKAPADALFASQARAVAADAESGPQHSLSENDNVSWLEAPDGSTWFCTTVYDSEEVPVPGGYGQTETYLKGFEYTIYDSDFNLVGTVRDKVELAEGQTRVRAIELSPVVTRKFFNSNDKYEIIVGTACNTQSNVVDYRSYAYTIGGEKDADGCDVPVFETRGYVIADFNNAADRWAEDFYIGFFTEYSDPTIDDRLEYLNSFKSIVTFYKKAGWGPAPTEFDSLEVQMVSLPGDQEATPFLVTFDRDGATALALSYYEKPYFIDPAPIDFDAVLEPTPDNNLVIEIYKVGADALVLDQQTKIAVEHDASANVATFYGIGAFRYDGDINYGDIDPSQPSKAAFMVTRQTLAGFNDDYEYSLLQYDADGRLLRTVAEGMENYVNLSDIKGFEPQCMFIRNSASDYTFDIVDLYSGRLVASLPHYIDGVPLTTTMDRVRVGDSYNWVFSAGINSNDIEGNTFEPVIWVNTDGEISRVDEQNIGKRVAYAKVYIGQDALDPYLFNTDPAREYMYLVKRYDESGVSTTEELMVVSSAGNTLLTLGPDQLRGNLLSVTIIDTATKPRLCAVYYNSADRQYTHEYYNLPLTRFAGGDGTEANPYMVATVGDLRQVAKEPTAHYRMACDIDASGFDMAPSDATFTGTFDGDGKFIKNLVISSDGGHQSLFGSLGRDAAVKNLNFVNARVVFGPEATQAGLLAVSAMGASVQNVHVYGLHIEAPEGTVPLVGGLVGKATNFASISDCSVSNVVISNPQGETGGIVGDMLTGSAVRACAFTGSIRGGVNVGGITGEIFAAESSVADCHVNAVIVADNTVGGIAGSNKRGSISNCHVEGTVEALAAPRWYDYGPCAGGIVGELTPAFASAETMAAAPAKDSADPAVCIRGNYVNLSSLRGFLSTDAEEWPGQHDTMHRIVGRTVANHDPAALEGSGLSETGLADNHAYDALAPVSAEADAAGVEGASVADDALGADFFAGLGFGYGDTTDTPWQSQPEWRPTLHHELSALALPAEVETAVGRKFYATAMFVSRLPLTEDEVLGGFTCEADEAMLQMTGDYSYADNTLAVEFEAMAPGETTISLAAAGVEAKVKVNILSGSGVGDVNIADSAVAIAFDGSAITAPGCRLTVFNVGGQLIDTAENTLAVDGLAPGVYIVRATDRAGNTATAKIAI